MMDMWVNEFWLFVTAVIFTVVGHVWGRRIEAELHQHRHLGYPR
jgi:hypothetical protein